MLQMQAFNATLEETIYGVSVEQYDVELSSTDKKNGYLTFLIENDFKNKKALKKRLKERGTSFKDFEKRFFRQLLIEKFKLHIISDISINDELVEKSLNNYKIQVIIFDQLMLNEDVDKMVLANEVYEKLEDGLDFTEAVKTYSENDRSKQKFGIMIGVKLGQLPEKIESVMLRLGVNDMSAPINTPFGIFIVKLM
jgi:parvulin-like peptidyl-prolyl isomerase